MDETRRRRVLFVCGFNPYSLCAWNTHYDAVRDFFASAGMDATYFTYTWAECAVSVYARLSGELKRDREYDDIVAHGMGCALVGEYFTRHPEEAGAYGSVVLCMPLITGDNAALALLTHVPFAGLVPLPAGVMSLLTLAAPASAAEMRAREAVGSVSTGSASSQKAGRRLLVRSRWWKAGLVPPRRRPRRRRHRSHSSARRRSIAPRSTW
jgi:pimeloyl-ACP methyl ester carboxylesterase